MARGNTLSRDVGLTLAFESVVVQDSGSALSKEFQNLSVEVVSGGKEVYLGSNYKVKWKNVTSLELCNDHGEEGFELVCTCTIHKSNPSPEQDSRSFAVRYPCEGSFGWKRFAALLATAYQKECRKRQRKQDKREAEQKEQEYQEQQQRKQQQQQRSGRGRNNRRTYSRRPYDFMRNNAANIAHNAEVWSDEEQDIYGSLGKRETEVEVEVEAEVEAEAEAEPTPSDEPNSEVPIADGGNEDNQDNDEEDEDEYEFHDSLEEGAGANEEHSDPSSAGNPKIIEDADAEDIDMSEEEASIVSTRRKSLGSSSCSVSKKKRFQRRAPILDDSDDEGDDAFLFGGSDRNRNCNSNCNSNVKQVEDDGVSVTTLGAVVQRVVTPAVASSVSSPSPTKDRTKAKPRLYMGDDDDEEENDEDSARCQEASEKPKKTSKARINSFFRPRSKATTADSGPKSLATNSPAGVQTPNERSEHDESPSSSLGSSDPKRDEVEGELKTGTIDTKTKAKTKTTTTTSSDARSDSGSSPKPVGGSFFAPRGSKPQPSAGTRPSPPVRNGGTKRFSTMADFDSCRKARRKSMRPTATKNALGDVATWESDETSTVAPTHTNDDTPMDEDGIQDDIESTHNTTPPKFQSPAPRTSSSKRKSDLVRLSQSEVRDGGRSNPQDVEDEDPIESSQSQSPSRPLFTASNSKRYQGAPVSTIVKRRRLKIQGSSRSALEALEFADARKLSPKTTSVRRERGRSPLQPLRLGVLVEKAATEREKPASSWRGLRNDGNSCYVNSSLQQLVSIPSFMEALSKRRAGHELVGKLSDLYEDLFRQSGRGSVVSAKGVKTVMDRLTDRFRGCQQRDAHEFLGELIDRIHEELAPSSNQNNNNNNAEGKENDRGNRDMGSPRPGCHGGDSHEASEASTAAAATAAAAARDVEPTDEYFRWNVRVCLECKHCGYSRSKEEMHRYLSIDIAHESIDPRDPGYVKPAVNSCLARFFSPEDREIDCEKCKAGKIATQTMKIISLPKVILLHLKRFIVAERPGVSNDTKELVLKKNRAAVELSQALSIDKTLLLDNDCDSSGSKSYRLRSVVHHIGDTADSGHYTTDALRANSVDGKDRWVSYDDGITTEQKLETVVGSIHNQKTAYMLLYSTA